MSSNACSSPSYTKEGNYEINLLNDILKHVEDFIQTKPSFMLMETTTQVRPLSSSDDHQWHDRQSNDNETVGVVVHQQRSNVFSGPTVVDIDKALSVKTNNNNSSLFHQPLSHSRISKFDKEFNKTDNKYTLNIKTTSTGMVDDGYKWRKYGQKYIKNSPNPRSYYKCTNPRCRAKKQVERSMEKPYTLIITYEGLHLHFAYPFFHTPSHYQQLIPPLKKTKKELQECHYIKDVQKEFGHRDELGEKKNIHHELPKFENIEPIIGDQGLLEDVVPLRLRNP